MKKLCSLLLILCLMFSLSACGNDNSAQNTDNGSSTTQNQTDLNDTSSTEQNSDYGSSDTDVPSSTTSTPSTTNKPEMTKPTTPTHTHNYSKATCTEPAKCACGAIQGDPTGHVFDGGNDEYCNKCSFKRVINCTHKNTKIASGYAATCENNGLTDGKICNDCGVFVVKQNSIVAKGHKVITDKSVAATCTKNGLTEGSHCETCGTIIKQQTSIPKTEHSYGSWKIIKDATTTMEGTKEKVCSCGHKITETIPKLPTKTVEITLDNFNNYFEIIQEDKISKNGFNEIEHIVRNNYLCLKTNEIKEFNVTVEVSYDVYVCNYSIDNKNESLAFTNLNYRMKSSEVITLSQKSNTLFTYLYNNKNTSAMYYDNFEIIRISGSVTIVEQ